jgi:hypothetical protein
MDENSFSQEEQEQFDEIANAEIDKCEAERKKEIEELGYPEWLITAFQGLRRLQDSLSRDRSGKTNAEIANEIENILSAYPDSLFAYDKKCLAEAHRAAQDLFDKIRNTEKERDSAP